MEYLFKINIFKPNKTSYLIIYKRINKNDKKLNLFEKTSIALFKIYLTFNLQRRLNADLLNN